MKTGTILRVGIYLVGVWLIVTALTGGVYQIIWYLRMPSFGSEEYAAMAIAGIYGSFVCPLVLGVLALCCAGPIQRLLLGREGDVVVSPIEVTERKLFRIGLKLLGLYLIGSYGGALVATVFEMVTIEAGSHSFDKLHAFSDLIANVLACAVGFLLAVKTEMIEGKTIIEPGATDNPDDAQRLREDH